MNSRDQGFTLLEMIFVTAIIALLAAIAIPTVFRSKLAANETSAIGTLRTIQTGQLTYTLTCGFGLYAASFPDLADPGSDGFLPPDLTVSPTPMKSGYKYELLPGGSGLSGLTDCHGNSTATEFYVSAVPIAVQDTGNRGFATSHDNTVWQDLTGLAPSEPFLAAGTVTAIE
jgi:type IV pilus assembly protein PilA